MIKNTYVKIEDIIIWVKHGLLSMFIQLLSLLFMFQARKNIYSENSIYSFGQGCVPTNQRIMSMIILEGHRYVSTQ